MSTGGGPKPDLYVLAIGIAEYEDPTWNLRYPDDDARDFVAACKRQEGQFYGNVRTRALVDQAATRESILDGIDWLERSATYKDAAFLFAYAHGVRTSEEIPISCAATRMTTASQQRLCRGRTSDACSVAVHSRW